MSNARDFDSNLPDQDYGDYALLEEHKDVVEDGL